jgi:membrane AbrB-like protein
VLPCVVLLPMSERFLNSWWGTPFVGLAGGYLASLIGWPLPWMIGSLLAIILVRCLTPWQLAEIPNGRKLGQWVVGIGIGLHFTPLVMEQVGGHFGLIFFGALITSVSSAVGVWLMLRTGEDRATAFFSSMPGGSGEMVNLGARNGADLSRVAAGSALRVLAVVLCVPALFKFLMGEGTPISHEGGVDWAWLALIFPLAGVVAWGWQRLDQPNPWLFGPLLVSAAMSVGFDLHIGLPDGGSQMGQWLIGSGLGCHFNRAFFRRAPSFLARTLVSTALTMAIAAVCALGLSALTQLDLRSLTLGMMPGGIAEMSLTAEVLQLSVPLVTAMQVMRLLFVLFLAEPLFRQWQKRRPMP